MSASDVLSRSAQETEAAGARLAARLGPGDVVLLRGEMGAGKTTFVRGALRALGVTGAVTSPTYTLVRRYGAISHLDLHRLDAFEDVLEEELGPDRIAFVEWPTGLDGDATVRVDLEHAGGDARRITVT